MRRARGGIWLLGIAVALIGGGCPPAPPPAPETPPPVPHPLIVGEAELGWRLSSPAFATGERIPMKYAGDGEDVSPPLKWGSPPEGTAELVLLCEDPDAPVGIWDHWVAYGMSPELRDLPQGVPAEATVAEPQMKQGLNSWKRVGYGGPAPPPGSEHRYQFRLFAVREALELEPGVTKQQVKAAMEGKILAETMLEGTYSR